MGIRNNFRDLTDNGVVSYNIQMWTNKEYQFLIPIKKLREIKNLSERKLAAHSKISRVTLRQIESKKATLEIQSLLPVSHSLDRQVAILGYPDEIATEYSTVAASMKILRDGFESWKIHFMDMVDEFRRTLDPRLILLPPVADLDFRLKSLLASIASELALEAEIDTPEWSKKRHTLVKPWFVAEMETLKASALIESPVVFRRNNIFVLNNFLHRA